MVRANEQIFRLRGHLKQRLLKGKIEDGFILKMFMFVFFTEENMPCGVNAEGNEGEE
jgi:hypothetical protein